MPRPEDPDPKTPISPIGTDYSRLALGGEMDFPGDPGACIEEERMVTVLANVGRLS